MNSYELLRYVSEHAGCRCTDIAAEFGVTKQRVSALLAKLRYHDFIARFEGVNEWYCTEKGGKYAQLWEKCEDEIGRSYLKLP